MIGAYMQYIATTLNIPMGHFLEGRYNIQMLPVLVDAYARPLVQPDYEYQPNSRIKVTDHTVL